MKINQKQTTLGLLFLLLACSRPEPDIGFYYWKSSFQLSAPEQAALDSLKVKRLYVKFFDLDMEQGALAPKAPVRFPDGLPQAYEVIPAVFITNRSFQAGLSPEDMADKAWDYLQQINRRHGLQPVEYQFDCDWTPSTRQAYFSFLRAIRRRMGSAALSATIRLHQYRYPEQSGVPPVDRGALMYYNMGDIERVEESNSILNNEKGFAYLQGGPYPLELDVALPIFSWVLVYQLGSLSAIITFQDGSLLDKDPRLEKIGPSAYQAKENFYFQGHFLNEGSLLRFEAPDKEKLEKAAARLGKINEKSGSILFYHLDEGLLENYPPVFLRHLSAHF